jgi:hypothetical protein
MSEFDYHPANGMFAYNTVTTEQLEYLSDQSNSDLEIIIPKILFKYSLKKK